MQNTLSSELLPHSKIEDELNKKNKEKDLHLQKAKKFYKLKRSYRKKSMKSDTFEAISTDNQKKNYLLQPSQQTMLTIDTN